MTGVWTVPAIIDRIVDGDTVYARADLGWDLTEYVRIRVFGINAPEMKTPAGHDAKTFAETLLKPGDNVLIISYGWDKFGGRTDAAIRFGDAPGRDFATEMIAAGHAVAWDGKGAKP